MKYFKIKYNKSLCGPLAKLIMQTFNNPSDFSLSNPKQTFTLYQLAIVPIKTFELHQDITFCEHSVTECKSIESCV